MNLCYQIFLLKQCSVTFVFFVNIFCLKRGNFRKFFFFFDYSEVSIIVYTVRAILCIAYPYMLQGVAKQIRWTFGDN